MVTIPEQQPYIQTIDGDLYQHKIAELAILRLDVIHPVISGNKWYKLQHNIAYCLENNIDVILTFGGAYSNHLVAAAAMAKLQGIKSIGIVRGEYAANNLTPTLQSCREYGMELEFVTNEAYSQKNDSDWLRELSERYHHPLIIPEGGANERGREGAGELTSLIPERFDQIAVSAGTGTTLAGIVNNIQKHMFVTGFAPMKGGAYLNEEIQAYIRPGRINNYRIYDNWHFGGFGKHNEALISFMNGFYQHTGIPLDMVYTAKMMYGLQEQILEGLYPEISRILCLHTGGLQGNTSICDRLVY